ncbi:glutamate--tRNA ligase [Lactobacillus kefiranofaciens]|uniref:Glutamate--tRNA ligase n=1 Tax=Lactobacillus kefiranofaciens TaxID=267818 RepID=A0AAX3UGV3_9LACO|nr:glutamate--tRNA ligase [Lactobacillus kefiranofaciens]AEG39742.1 Glutamyl-tRNA synthetase [Lactobacillus kefiranofaciens subsp. kefiranofaciens]KRM22913.1 glutamyl-tRNA synthetase [Lactobacillus kefiranofaciens subsp. kefiranofaciens DSM 5016 = JCM 6985]MCP9330412.1 glutamate--tRNA ligase [Lactobacillus kefiranofaciens]MDF4143202.1 glutamate--tRNA ligase [Lactobacillus kefiranofaciens]PAK99234.1 glutamate--tRNA ligase [Lactobacillus kefiranofaciens]
MAKEKIRVRYAPSPTGHLHIGNARTALFNYLFARHNKGTMVLRIEDTDQKRNVKGGSKSQMENLHWLGIDWDEGPDKGGDYGPYRQSERKAIYQKYIDQLIDEGKAYYSYKTEEELETQREEQRAAGIAPHYTYEYEGMTADEIKQAQDEAKAKGLKPVVRIHIPEMETYSWDDIVKGHLEFESDTIGGDFVIQKRDGMPTYNFAVVIDDHLMKITHVLRGDDHVSNTPKQLVVYQALGWKPPKFGHMTLIINSETGKKLSKRDESVLQFIEQYRDLGYLPEAMFNFITLLGWSPKGENEIFNKREFIKQFDPARLSKSPAAFDQKKLEWINNQYIKKADRDTLLDLALNNLQEAGLIDEHPTPEKMEWVRQLVNIYSVQMSYTKQIVDMAKIFFEDAKDLSDEEIEEIKNDDGRGVIEEFKKQLDLIPRFTSVQIMNAIQATRHATGIKGRKLFMPIRIATTRSMVGPGIGEAMELLGKKRVVEHIDLTLKQMSANNL